MTSTYVLLSIAVLAAGAGLGLVSRLILGDRSSMSPSGSVLAGIVGAVIGGVVTQVAMVNRPTPPVVPILIFSVAGTLAVLVVAERFIRTPPPSIAEVVAGGESAGVEYKSTARHNRHTGQRDERMEAVISKTIAGFLNTRGGTLVIGVDDDGHAVGLDADLSHMKEPDLDRYELWLHDHLTRTLGAPAAALVRVTFPTVDGVTVCRVDVPASRTPVYVRQVRRDSVSFVARFGNSTRELDVADAIDYSARHFGHRLRRRAR